MNKLYIKTMGLRDIKTKGNWVYAHILPNKSVYFGHSGQQPYQRWIPKHYLTTTLYSQILEFGWKNIEHIVICDNLTERQAEVLEDFLIKQGKKDGLCINDRNVLFDKKQHEKERSKRRWATNENYRKYQKAYGIVHQRELRQKPEYKIYDRVRSFNRRHPDKIVETPLEAKQKYLEWGYIPNYVKINL